MVRRSSVGIIEVSEFSNLVSAYVKAARGKRDRVEVREFAQTLEARLRRIRHDLLDGEWMPGPFREFRIHDPKPRTIHAPSFEDRVVHHAIMNVIGPVLERPLIADSYACRKGKGSLAAVARAQEHTARYSWFLKVDVGAYFDSIGHDILKQQLGRHLKSTPLLSLLGRIIESYATDEGRGLPIGALTSQYLANLYLSPLDHWIEAQTEALGWVRYMDDMVVWCANRKHAKSLLLGIIETAKCALGLEIKSTWLIQRTVLGVPLCGYRIFARYRLLSRRRRRRYTELRRYWESAYREGRIDSFALQRAYESTLAITLHADSGAWRKREMRLRPTVEA